jgi:hypothetical protein
MTPVKTTNVRVPSDLYEEIGALEIEGEQSTAEKTRELIKMGMTALQDRFELDDTIKQSFFSHLTIKKGEEYKDQLKTLELTENELVSLALEKSGLTYAQLMKQAVLSTAKELVTRETRRQFLEESGIETPELRIQKAISQLEREMFEGTYRPKNGKIGVSRIAGVSGCNYNTVKTWLQENQPELLD